MGLFNRNQSNNGQGNVMESIQRAHDTGTLIYLDPCENFNTNSVITVAPNEQVIFIKNGQLYGVLSSGREQVKTENYPVLSALRNVLTGGQTTFTCQVYHVNTNEQLVHWGTSAPIEIQDFFLGRAEIGVPTLVRGRADFRVRFNIREDNNAAVQTFMRLMGDKSQFTTNDLELLFQAQFSQEISNVVATVLEETSMTRSINAISSKLKSFANELKPTFDELFYEYGLELVNFAFLNLSIEDTEERRKFRERRTAGANVGDARYNQAVQQELLENITVNPGAGGIASAGAGLGMGMAAGNAFAQMATTAFAQPQQPAQQQPFGFSSNNRFGTNAPQAQAQPQQSADDPMEVLTKLKRMLDAGLISQEKYDAKVDEILGKL
ncbi:MAG: SPFH domain-containing protein [Bacteroides sp.]|nr:SPFH domain-containing protein [Bacteroides sp.]MCM1456300.1 SPFH domain-containing protein [Lachnoclostridium sp.]